MRVEIKRNVFLERLINLFGSKPCSLPECLVDTSHAVPQEYVIKGQPNTTASGIDDSDIQIIEVKKIDCNQVKKSGTDL